MNKQTRERVSEQSKKCGAGDNESAMERVSKASTMRLWVASKQANEGDNERAIQLL